MRVFNGISFETGARTHKYFKPRGGKYSARKKRQMGAILVYSCFCTILFLFMSEDAVDVEYKFAHVFVAIIS